MEISMRGCASCDAEKLLPHTVKAPSVPLYQLGWLGDDIPNVDPSTGLPWTETPITPIDVNLSYPNPWSVPSPSPDYPPISQPGVVYGPPAAGQPGSVVTAAAPSFLQALANFFRPNAPAQLPLGPSPRVSSLPSAGIFGSSISLGSALPLLAVGMIAIVVLSGGRRR